MKRHTRFTSLTALLVIISSTGSFLFFGKDARGNASSEDDLLLFEVVLDHTLVSDNLSAYRVHQHIYVPLGAFSQALSLAINVDPAQKTASGFILSETRIFSLDLSHASVTVDGKTSSFDPQMVQARADDLYVESELLSTWLPAKISVDIPELALTILPKETLPLQSKIKRGLVRLPQAEDNESGRGFSQRPTPYQWIDRPFIDQTVQSAASRKSDSPTQTEESFTTLATGDLLGLESAFYLSGDNHNHLSDHRLTMGRDDPDGHLLGPLHAQSFSVGAITMPGLNYVSHANSLGTGAYVTNRPLTRPSRFDTHSFTGELLPGWDVELYQNGIPIRHQQTPENGRYRFDDIPLVFGANDFRVILHGPFGQQKEEHYRFLLEDSITQPGEFYYTTGITRLSDGSERSLVQFDKSILNNLSATGGMVSVPVSDLRERYFNLGVRSFWNFMFLSADVVRSSDNGTLEGLGVSTSIGSISLTANQTILQNFTSEVFTPSADPIHLQTKLRMDSYIPIPVRLPVSLELAKVTRISGDTSYDMSGRVSGYVMGLSVSNQLNYHEEAQSSTFDGALQVGRHISSIGLRGGLAYSLSPTLSLASIDLNAQKSLGPEYSITQSITSQVTTKLYHYETDLNKTLGTFGLGLRLGGSSSGDEYIGLRLNIALGVEPRKLDLYASAEPMSETGAVSAQVFLDKNRNKVKDDDEQPLAGYGFLVDGVQTEQKTDKDGIIFLDHLPTRQWVNIGLDPMTIEDPQFTPRMHGIRILPRRGKVVQAAFPVDFTTEVDGIIYRTDNGKPVPASEVELELVDKQGVVVSSTKSSADGYYILPTVPAGNFTLRVSPDQASRLNITSPDLRTVRVLPDSLFVNGINATISLPLQKHLPLPENEKSRSTAANGKRLHTRSHPGKFFYVNVGAFVESDHVKKIEDLLRAEHLNFTTETVTSVVPVYRIRVGQFPSTAPADALAEKLKTYGYSPSRGNSGSMHNVYVGPYYSQNDVKTDRAVIAAAIPSAITETTKESAQLTVFQIGGYAWRESAEEVRARLLETGMVDESLIRELSQRD